MPVPPPMMASQTECLSDTVDGVQKTPKMGTSRTP